MTPLSTPPLIHVVDDDESLRTSLLRLLGAAGFDVQGYGSTGEFLLNPVPDRPGCLLLDVQMPGPSGLDLQLALQQRGTVLPIVFLTGRPDVDASVKAMKGGAVDFLQKPIESAILLEAIARALARDAVQRKLHQEIERLNALFASLSNREREIFDRVVDGKRNKQIADEFSTSERTVKAQRAQVMLKLGVESAAALGGLAERLRQSAK